MNIPSPDSNSSRTLLPNLSCQASSTSAGLFSTLLGSFHLAFQQTSNTTASLDVYSSTFASVRTAAVHCDYQQCELLSSVDCSEYVSGYPHCLRCAVSNCTLNLNKELHLFEENETNRNDTKFSSSSSSVTEMEVEVEMEMKMDDGISYFRTDPTLNPLLYFFGMSNQAGQQSSSPTIFACHEQGDCIWSQVRE